MAGWRQGLLQISAIDVSLATPAKFAVFRPEVIMTLSAIAARLKSRFKDDFKGRHFGAGLIV